MAEKVARAEQALPEFGALEGDWNANRVSRAKPSPLEPYLAEAAKHIGSAYTITASEDWPERYIVNQLHKAKAAVNGGVKIQTRVDVVKHEDGTETTVVKFRVVEPTKK
jgi:hypothetical protein